MAPWDRRVYRKPILTNLYLKARSHYHPANKQAVLSPVVHKTKAICDLGTPSINGYSNGQILQALYPPKMVTSTPKGSKFSGIFTLC
jgi:hypothetical protein